MDQQRFHRRTPKDSLGREGHYKSRDRHYLLLSPKEGRKVHEKDPQQKQQRIMQQSSEVPREDERKGCFVCDCQRGLRGAQLFRQGNGWKQK